MDVLWQLDYQIGNLRSYFGKQTKTSLLHLAICQTDQVTPLQLREQETRLYHETDQGRCASGKKMFCNLNKVDINRIALCWVFWFSELSVVILKFWGTFHHFSDSSHSCKRNYSSLIFPRRFFQKNTTICWYYYWDSMNFSIFHYLLCLSCRLSGIAMSIRVAGLLCFKILYVYTVWSGYSFTRCFRVQVR